MISLKWEKQDARVVNGKVDPDRGATGPGRRSGCDGTDRGQYRIIGRCKSATVDSRSPDRPPSAARRPGALGEKPERSERSTEQGKRRARSQDQEHLPRLLGRALT